MEDFETMGDYLEKYNPFALKDEKNRIRHFKTREDIYRFVLEDIRKYCKRGYVEVALLVKHFTQFDDDTCKDISEAARKEFADIRNEPLFIDWANVGREKGKLSALLKTLHLLTETEFDWASFEYVWIFYKEWVKEYNEQEANKENV